jgi:hypothetical protein
MTRSPQDTASDSSAEGSIAVPSTAERTLSDASAAPTIADILGPGVMAILTGLLEDGLDFDPNRDLGADFEAHLRGNSWRNYLTTEIQSEISKAKRTDPKALAFIGAALKSGMLPTFERDPNLALRLLTAGALAGSASALNTLSNVFKNGWDSIRSDPTKSRTLHEASIAERTPGSAEVRSWYAARQ